MNFRSYCFLPGNAFRLIALSGLLAGAVGLTSCLNPEGSMSLENPPADSVVFWPPTMKYARQGDTLYLRVHGLKRQATCAIPVQVGWNFHRDTTGTEFYRVRSAFEVPQGCPADPDGLDTLFRVRFYTRTGNTLYLETPDTVITDSMSFIAGDAPAFAYAGTLRLVVGESDSVVGGRYTYRDSTAAHPRRMLHVSPLATCEVLQTAVYETRKSNTALGPDTTVVKFRLIQAAQRAASVFPPCAGPRNDSVEVVFNRYNFLP